MVWTPAITLHISTNRLTRTGIFYYDSTKRAILASERIPVAYTCHSLTNLKSQLRGTRFRTPNCPQLPPSLPISVGDLSCVKNLLRRGSWPYNYCLPVQRAISGGRLSVLCYAARRRSYKDSCFTAGTAHLSYQGSSGILWCKPNTRCEAFHHFPAHVKPSGA